MLLKITTAMLDASINAIAMLQALARLGNMCDVMSLDGFESMREREPTVTVTQRVAVWLFPWDLCRHAALASTTWPITIYTENATV